MHEATEIIKCKMCARYVERTGPRHMYCKTCMPAARKIKNAEYARSNKAKASHRKYRATDKGQQALKRARDKPSRKEYMSKYNKTDEHKAIVAKRKIQRELIDNFMASPEGQAGIEAYKTRMEEESRLATFAASPEGQAAIRAAYKTSKTPPPHGGGKERENENQS